MKKLQDNLLLSEEETIRFGREFALNLGEGDIIALHGELGSGKTTLVKGIVEAIGKVEKRYVQSPTFTYLNIYECLPPIYHFDLYRLKGEQEFLSLGLLDYFEEKGICLVEWAERISALLPAGTIHVTLSQVGEDKRRIDVYKS